MYARSRLKRLREEGKCVQCGKPLDRDGSLCSVCVVKSNERSREEKQFFKENNLCFKCHAKVYDGKRYCETCRIEQAECNKRYYKRNREKICEKENERRNKKRAERRELGLCPRCGKKAMTGRKYCGLCLEYAKNRQRERRGNTVLRSESYQYGLCYQCKKEDVIPGKKLCEKCYQRCMDNLKKGVNNENVLKNREYIKRHINSCFHD